MPNVAQLIKELRASVTRFRLPRIDHTYSGFLREKSSCFTFTLRKGWIYGSD